MYCFKDAHELMKFQLRHGNDLLAMDAIRNADVSLYRNYLLFVSSYLPDALLRIGIYTDDTILYSSMNGFVQLDMAD